MSEQKRTVWSHSSTNELLSNPAEYYLDHIVGIKPKQEKTALSMGSAVHWGLEMSTSDLQPYYNEKGNFKQWNNYSDEQCLAECIVEAYLKKKGQIYTEMLTDPETGEMVELIDEYRELKLTCEIPSMRYEQPHLFLGIIDLLLLTSKGFILIDYKTGSQKIDWDEYKSQLKKYIKLKDFNFPEMPIWKVCIIHLTKTSIKRKKNENDWSFRQRIKMEYDLNEDNLIELHTYGGDEFELKDLEDYTKQLSLMLDTAQMIRDNQMWFINFSSIKGLYGSSPYADIYYKSKDNYALYFIKDKVYDEFDGKLAESRDCVPIDMLVLDRQDILNKYEKFKEEASYLIMHGFNTRDRLFGELKKKYLCDDKLLAKYLLTYQKGF